MKHNNLKLFLATLLSASLGGCGSSSEVATVQSAEPSKPELVVKTEDEFKNAFNVVELDSDNWNDYFEVVETSYDKLDSFGEVESTEVGLALTTKENIELYYPSNFEVTFRFLITNYKYAGTDDFDSETHEFNYDKLYYFDDGDQAKDITLNPLTQVYSGANVPNFIVISEGKRYTLGEEYLMAYQWDDVQFDKVAGTIYVVDIPDEWWNTDEEGNEFIAIISSTRESSESETQVNVFYNHEKKTENGYCAIYYGIINNETNELSVEPNNPYKFPIESDSHDFMKRFKFEEYMEHLGLLVK